MFFFHFSRSIVVLRLLKNKNYLPAERSRSIPSARVSVPRTTSLCNSNIVRIITCTPTCVHLYFCATDTRCRRGSPENPLEPRPISVRNNSPSNATSDPWYVSHDSLRKHLGNVEIARFQPLLEIPPRISQSLRSTDRRYSRQ